MVARHEPALVWPTVARVVWPGKVADVGVGLSVATWGVVGIAFASPGEAFAPPRIALSALQIVVGALLLARAPLKVGATSGQLAAALPSLLVSGAAMAVAPPLESWQVAAEALFVLGAAGAILSLASLGRCFAILPGARGVVVGGPYRLLRHPAYACELVMVAGCAIAIGFPLGLLGFAGVAALVVLRVLAEERPLRRLPAYGPYASRTRWRLVPLVW